MNNKIITYKCGVCNSNLIKIINFKKIPIGDHYTKKKIKHTHYPLKLFLCNKCLCGQINCIIHPDKLYKSFTYKTKNSFGLVDHYKKLYKEILSEVKIKKKDNVVEIGCNDGSLISLFKKNFTAIGIDPASKVLKHISKKKIFLINSYFNETISKQINNKFGKAKVIICNNTIANIYNLKDFLKSVKKLLDKDGFFIFETGSFYKILNNYLFDTVYHEHIYYFSAKSLELLFLSNNMKLVKLKYINTKGGSYRGYVQHLNHKNAKKKINLVKAEGNYKAYLEYALNFKNKLKVYKSFIMKEFKNFELNKYKIFGYGASVGTTTFLSYFNISKKLSGLVDDNKEKINTISPINNLKVFSLKYLSTQKKKIAFLIISWRYKKQIIKKINKFFQINNSIKIIRTFPNA